MDQPVPSTCAVIFVNLSTNSVELFLHYRSPWGSTTSPTKPSWLLISTLSPTILFTTLWASFGLLGSPTSR